MTLLLLQLHNFLLYTLLPLFQTPRYYLITTGVLYPPFLELAIGNQYYSHPDLDGSECQPHVDRVLDGHPFVTIHTGRCLTPVTVPGAHNATTRLGHDLFLFLIGKDISKIGPRLP